MSSSNSSLPLPQLREIFGDALQENAAIAKYVTAHVGGPVDALLIVNSAAELERAALHLWELRVPFRVLGAGSNIMISDTGLRGVAILNRAKRVEFDKQNNPPTVWAESGANFGTIARQAALRGLGGLEWAATVPGTLGGAVYGNAGAYGGVMQERLILAEILHPTGKESWTVEQMGYAYRSSILKREGLPAVILSARLKLEHADPAEVQAKMEANSAHRRRTQPPGASMGSMFKNPAGDFAGRLIEAAGLKGTRFGDAEISPIHANFFINHGHATAAEIGQLIQIARETVAEKFGVQLELEVELLGDWPAVQINAQEQN